jgi:hypothetical protein
MAHDIHIPPAALEAGARAFIERRVDACVWVHLSDESRRGYQAEMRAAFLAMLEAWPGMTLHRRDINAEYSYFVLPLPQEASDE